MTLSPALSAAEPYRRTLISAERNLHIDRVEITSKDTDIQTQTPFRVTKETLRGGKQEGVDVIHTDNGRLRFTVIPTRGMGIAEVRLDDLLLGWDSPVKEIVHPKFINLESRGGLGWLEGFNEWLVRCGLEFAGHPGKDKFINNTGDEAEMDLTLHGKIGNIPASEVEIVIDRDPPHRLRVRGRVDERMFYGPKLELWTEISTEPGSTRFRIEDRIRNHGAFDQEFQLIYHANFGPPLLEAGARFVAPLKQAVPFNAHAAKDVDRFAEYAGPQNGYIEQVYCLHPYADAQGRTTVMLRNRAANRGISMTFSLEQLPYLTLWKNTTALEEGYVTGLEPGTGFPYNRRLERKAGRVPRLKPGETRIFTLEFELLTRAAEVEQAASRIGRIHADRPTQIEREPQQVD